MTGLSAADPEAASAVASFRALADVVGMSEGMPAVHVRVDTERASTVAAAIGRSRSLVPIDERFEIRRADDEISLTAASTEGAFRALVRLMGDVPGPHTAAEDGPRFAWRGLAVDVVRHPFDADAITRIIDLLALHGLNVLHLHLTDTQAWRLPFPHPFDDATPGAFRRSELERIVEHAERRFVTVVPEIDLPGHCAALLAAVPDLADPERPAPHPLFSWVDPSRTPAVEFIRRAIAELAEVFPSSVLHIGGDEAFGMPREAYGAALRVAVDAAHAAGRAAIAWQEAVRAPVDVDIHQLWMTPEDVPTEADLVAAVPPAAAALARIAAATFAEAIDDPGRLSDRAAEVILSPQDPLYLDRRYAEASIDADQTAALHRLGFPGYRPRPSTDLLGWDPLSALPSGCVPAGIECAIWSETIENIDDLAMLLLPRLLLVADCAWRRGPVDPQVILDRITTARRGWERLGFGAAYRSVLLEKGGAT